MIRVEKEGGVDGGWGEIRTSEITWDREIQEMRWFLWGWMRDFRKQKKRMESEREKLMRVIMSIDSRRTEYSISFPPISSADRGSSWRRCVQDEAPLWDFLI